MERTIYFDGACEPRNPGGWATWGWVALRDGKAIASGRGCVGHGDGMTNNVAEYTAAIEALRWLSGRSAGPGVVLRGDSQLVVRQVSGEWGCNADHLRPLLEEARRLVNELGVRLEWIPRGENSRADALSRLAYREALAQ